MAKSFTKVLKGNFFYLFFLIILLIYLFILLVLFNQKKNNQEWKETTETEKEKIKEVLIPSDLLSEKGKYAHQKINIRGKTFLLPVVCQRKDCPPEDKCCGCPPERDLFVSDPEMVLLQEKRSQLKLVDQEGKSLCQRKTNSCEYSCNEWIPGVVYDIWGEFIYDPPPPGWKRSLDFYFRAENKIEAKRVNPIESLSNFWKEIRGFFQRLTTSNSYIIF